jgi:hypothetical protein
MICPKCAKDYKDVPEGRIPGHFYRGDDHFYKNYRRFGYQCTNCGFVAEFITKATGMPYKKRDIDQGPETIDMFEDFENE